MKRPALLLGLLAIALAGGAAWLATRGKAAARPAPGARPTYDARGRPPEGVAPKVRPHVVIVCLEGVRADALAPPPGSPPAMPSLARLAERGVRFREATAPSPRGALSVASLLTGLSPRQHKTAAGGLNEFVPTLPEILSAVGYRTAAWVGPSVADRVRGLRQGFGAWEVARSLPDAGGAIEAWLRSDAAAPTFLFLHAKPVIEPPLVPPADDSDPALAARRARAANDTALSRLDTVAADLIARVERSLSPAPIVVLTSTHGRALLEHGRLGTGGALHEENVRVPLVIWGPGVPVGERRGAWGLVDVATSVLSLLWLPPLEGDGLPLLGDVAAPADRVLEAQEFVRVPSPRGPSNHVLWSLRSTRAKYVVDFDTRTTEGTETLYDLEADPGETSPLPIDQVPRFGQAFADAVEELRRTFEGQRKLVDDLAHLGYTGAAGRDFPPPEDEGPPPR